MLDSPIKIIIHQDLKLDPKDRDIIDRYNNAIQSGHGQNSRDIILLKGSFGFILNGSDQQFFELETLLEGLAKKYEVSWAAIKIELGPPQAPIASRLIIPLYSKASHA